ncbi:MAG TPA: hypothetical protein VFE62_20410 [Gemmataceae bacterium]|nr:hypothetical protein [Gemmataceae bacterium]
MTESAITRRFLPHDQRTNVATDEFGFVVAAQDTLSLDEVMSRQAVLIRGHPWVGKTFISRQIYNQPSSHGEHAFVWRLDMQDFHRGKLLKPAGWDNWLQGDHRALWIIDGIDNGEAIEPNAYGGVLDCLEAVDGSARQRLTVLMFCRDSEVPPRLLPRLSDLHYLVSEVVLLGLDAESARHLVGDRFALVLELIQRFHLQSLASVPAALEYLKSLVSGSNVLNLNDRAVWEGVLKELLREKGSKPTRTPTPAEVVNKRFAAAARLAIAMTFCDVEHFRTSDHDISGIDVSSAFARPALIGEISPDDARAALRTEMFSQGRFVDRHVREWMCAIGLGDWRKPRLLALLTSKRGGPEPRHRAVIGLLQNLATPDVRRWLHELNGGKPFPSDLVQLRNDEVDSLLDQIEAEARRAPIPIHAWELPALDALELLRTPGVGKLIAKRIANRRRAWKSRVLLLDLARELSVTDVVPVAAEVLRNPHEPDELRRTAAGVMLKVAEASQLHELDEFVRTAEPDTDIQRSFIAHLILRFLESEFWTAEQAAELMPLELSDDVDGTYLLSQRMQKSSSLTAARTLVGRLIPKVLEGDLWASSPDSGEFWALQLFHAAVRTLLSPEQPSDCDLETLLPLALLPIQRRAGLDVPGLLTQAFARSAKMRRVLYRESIEKDRGVKDRNLHPYYRWLLIADDIEWLIGQLPELAEGFPEVWDDLAFLVGDLTSEAAEKARIVLELHQPGRIQQLAAARRTAEEAIEKQKQELARQEQDWEQKKVTIGHAVRQVLDRAKLSSVERMRQLSWLCFASDQARPRNLVGTWDDLPNEVREEVLDVCQTALISGSGPVPTTGTTFPASILFDAYCFKAVVSFRGNQFTLNDEMIRKWLPAAFVVTIQSFDEVLDICFSVAATATEDVVLKAIEQQLDRGSTVAVAADAIKAAYWSRRFSERVKALIENDRYADAARAELFRVFASRTAKAEVVVMSIISQRQEGPLRQAALNELVYLNPTAAWPFVISDFERRRKAALVDLPALYGVGRASAGDLMSWSANQLLDLARMLYDAVPPADDEELDGWVTAEKELAWLRGRIPSFLWSRRTEADIRVLEQLVAEQPRLRAWYDQVRAIGAASKALDVGPPGFLPLAKVIELADNPNFRIVRHNDDLLEVVTELLERIEETTGRYVEMLYLPGEAITKRHEGALQAFIVCRLTDLLPQITGELGTQVLFHRECQESFRQRTDILVSVPTVDGGKAMLVIEAKWSDNQDRKHNVSTGLRLQLANRYLIPEKRTHGIFLVGWSGRVGTWARDAGEKPATADALRRYLERQARKCAKKPSALIIRPFILNLEWPTDVFRGASKKRRSRP